MTELRDVYVLSTQDIASELIQDSKLAAQIEFQRQNTIARAVVATIFAEFTVTEEELLAEYEEEMKQAPQLQFKARHILVATQREAVDVIGQLDGGANFEELAKQVSTDQTGANGGDLDWFTPNQMVAPFSTAVAAMEDGVYTSTPVQTQFGWHVILREDSRESTPPTFENVRDAISQQVQQKKFEARMEILRAAAKK
jgi:peptidyl-prolyl cis-trans isomerase C